MAVYEVMLVEAREAEALNQALAAVFDSSPEAVIPLGGLIGGDEGRFKRPIVLDRRAMSGDVAACLSIAVASKLDVASVAADLAAKLRTPTLFGGGGVDMRRTRVTPDGESTSVTLDQDEETGDVRIRALTPAKR